MRTFLLWVSASLLVSKDGRLLLPVPVKLSGIVSNQRPFGNFAIGKLGALGMCH
ncbi:hypothetical protein N9094_01760 [bacterium]|nr:hypothetical protein [bacterium]MDB4507908.1 hypothetical protein [bacterium]